MGWVTGTQLVDGIARFSGGETKPGRRSYLGYCRLVVLLLPPHGRARSKRASLQRVQLAIRAIERSLCGPEPDHEPWRERDPGKDRVRVFRRGTQ